jgi:hypothetical protein
VLSHACDTHVLSSFRSSVVVAVMCPLQGLWS